MSSSSRLLDRRNRLLGPYAPLFYDEPLHLVRGQGVWLYDVDGRRYLDAYNNVPHVGHAHPHVVEALIRQAGLLNISTRYLYDPLVDYGEKLLSTGHKSLNRALFVCTGSEANELALRIARHATGNSGVIVSDFSYHGNSATLASLTTAFPAGEKWPAAARAVPIPNPYRHEAGPEGDPADHALLMLDRAIRSLQDSGDGVAAFLVDTLFSTEGLPSVPSDFLSKAASMIRNAGGVLIADEVQPGLGRTGKAMWGYELHNFVPDLVTTGKPMGNGHPLAMVMTRDDLADSFTRNGLFFNTFAGNPVSCAAGLAVLEVIEQEGLIENANVVGTHLRDGLHALAQKHSLIGDVRGRGLFVGVDLVKDRATCLPAASEARYIINELRRRGILISKIGPGDNVLKVRPPMPFSSANADELLAALDDTLTRI